eukprot:g9136.t1
MAFWRRYGLSVVVVLLIALLSVGGYLLWSSHREKRALENSDRYARAVELIDQSDDEGAKKILQTLVKEGQEGYAFLAQARLATLAGRAAYAEGTPQATEKAQEAYDLLSSSPLYVGTAVPGIAVFGKAYMMLNTAPDSFSSDQLSAYKAPRSPWLGLALETQALSLYMRGQVRGATQLYAKILESQDVSYKIKLRVGLALMGMESALPEMKGEKGQKGA